MEGTAEVGAAVALTPARAACLSSGCVATALTPHAQLVVAALLIFGARLGEEEERVRLFQCHSVCFGSQLGALK